MIVKGKYIVLEGSNGITLHGNSSGEVNYNESAYTVLFEGTITELKKTEYKYLIDK
jgi:hypothetical protein